MGNSWSIVGKIADAVHENKHDKLEELLKKHHDSIFEEDGMASKLISYRTSEDRSLLCVASGKGYLRIAEQLVSIGCDVNYLSNRTGIPGSPLHEAVLNQKEILVEFLLDHGAHPFVVNRQGVASYDLARKVNSRFMLRLMEKKAFLRAFISCLGRSNRKMVFKDRYALLIPYFETSCWTKRRGTHEFMVPCMHLIIYRNDSETQPQLDLDLLDAYIVEEQNRSYNGCSAPGPVSALYTPSSRLPLLNSLLHKLNPSNVCSVRFTASNRCSVQREDTDTLSQHFIDFLKLFMLEDAKQQGVRYEEYLETRVYSRKLNHSLKPDNPGCTLSYLAPPPSAISPIHPQLTMPYPIGTAPYADSSQLLIGALPQQSQHQNTPGYIVIPLSSSSPLAATNNSNSNNAFERVPSSPRQSLKGSVVESLGLLPVIQDEKEASLKAGITSTNDNEFQYNNNRLNDNNCSNGPNSQKSNNNNKKVMDVYLCKGNNSNYSVNGDGNGKNSDGKNRSLVQDDSKQPMSTYDKERIMDDYLNRWRHLDPSQPLTSYLSTSASVSSQPPPSQKYDKQPQLQKNQAYQIPISPPQGKRTLDPKPQPTVPTTFISNAIKASSLSMLERDGRGKEKMPPVSPEILPQPAMMMLLDSSIAASAPLTPSSVTKGLVPPNISASNKYTASPSAVSASRIPSQPSNVWLRGEEIREPFFPQMTSLTIFLKELRQGRRTDEGARKEWEEGLGKGGEEELGKKEKKDVIVETRNNTSDKYNASARAVPSANEMHSTPLFQPSSLSSHPFEFSFEGLVQSDAKRNTLLIDTAQKSMFPNGTALNNAANITTSLLWLGGKGADHAESMSKVGETHLDIKEAMCVMCITSEATTIVRHGDVCHPVLCEQCAEDWFYTRRERLCPKCRIPFDGWLREIRK